MLLKQMEYLQAVVKSNSFFEAGELCHVTQSAISQQIKKLENELGVKLLNRHNRTFSLTPAGEYFFQHSLAIVKETNNLVEETKRLASLAGDSLRLGCYYGFTGDFLTAAIAEFKQKFPNVTVTINMASHEELFYAKENDSIDISLSDQRRAFSAVYNNLVLATGNLYIKLPKNHLLSHKEWLTEKDLAKLNCIIIGNHAAWSEDSLYSREIIGLTSNFGYAADSSEADLKLISQTGFCPVFLIRTRASQEFSYIPFMRNGERLEKNFCAFWKKTNKNSCIEKFIAILQEKIKKYQQDC